MVSDTFILLEQKVNKANKRREIKNKKQVINLVCYSEMSLYDYFTSCHIFLYNIIFFFYFHQTLSMDVHLAFKKRKNYPNTRVFVVFCFVYSV